WRRDRRSRRRRRFLSAEPRRFVSCTPPCEPSPGNRVLEVGRYGAIASNSPSRRRGKPQVEGGLTPSAEARHRLEGVHVDVEQIGAACVEGSCKRLRELGRARNVLGGYVHGPGERGEVWGI